MNRSHLDNVAQTYLALRLGIVAIVVFLAISLWLFIASVDEPKLLDSISAYFYTPIGAAFVGTLFAVGISLIAYRGNSELENFILDFAGFVAFLIAIIPTPNHPNLNPKNDDAWISCSYCVIPDEAVVMTVVETASWALLAVGVIATITGVALGRRTASGERQELGMGAWLAIGASGILLVVFALLLSWDLPLVVRIGHGAAAFTFFGAVIAVVIVNAVDFGKKKRRGAGVLKGATNPYLWVALAMGGSLAAVGIAHLTNSKWSLFVLEGVLILLFGIYWAIQTFELRATVERQPEGAE